jgi:hypothetical protein
MLLTSTDLEAIQHYCSCHKPLLLDSSHAGCIRCGSTFSPDEIHDWIDESDGKRGHSRGETAVCPRCGVDAVLPSAAPVAMDAHLLSALQSYWFGGARTE